MVDVLVCDRMVYWDVFNVVMLVGLCCLLLLLVGFEVEKIDIVLLGFGIVDISG